MAVKEIESVPQILTGNSVRRDRVQQKLAEFPWWFLGIVLIAAMVVMLIVTRASYQEAFGFIKNGLWITISTTLVAYLIALGLGLLAGFGRISQSVFWKNLSTLYIELVRGIPMLVLIFFIALVGVPALVSGINLLGKQLVSLGMDGIGSGMAGLQVKSVSMSLRAIVALAVTYGAFQAEIFRAGIQSVNPGQMEAARSQGMTYFQGMRYVVLPQAIRNVLPALGNEFISMLKDSSLVSVLAVRDITQVARLYAGQSFKFEETYITLAVLYLIMTIGLSMLVKFLESRTKRYGYGRN